MDKGLSPLVEFLPELARLVGDQPPAEKVDAQAAQIRFRRGFTRLVQALATPETPLVLFLDDLQWTDPSTPDLLLELFSQNDIRNLLVVGAFRDNEIHDGHLLELALRQLRERAPDAVEELVVGPLAPAALSELVADTLRTTPERCLPLAAAILEKSQGNPLLRQ